MLHILNAYLPDQIAGTEIYVNALARELKNFEVESKILIPNYGSNDTIGYEYEEVEVIKYAEPTKASRDIITGKKAPGGLETFLAILKNESPDIVHYHELAGSIGIGNYHLKASHELGFKNIITFHVVKYSCKTGTLMYMGKQKCDGIIKKLRCSKCWLHHKGEVGLRRNIITAGFTFTKFFNLDTSVFNNELGTALAFPKLIERFKKTLLSIQANTSKIIVLTDWYKNILIKNGIAETHIELIYQGLPTKKLPLKVTKPTSQKLRIIYVGRISHFKGVDVMLCALQHVDPDLFLLDIYGGCNEDDYMMLCKSLSASNKSVQWKRALAPELVIQTIQQYDIICIPSAVSEMGPFVLKEAFAAGVPAVASDVYGNAEQIEHGQNGWLFKYNDVEDLRKNIENLISNPSLIGDANLKMKPVKEFSLVAQEHLVLYQNTAAGK